MTKDQKRFFFFATILLAILIVVSQTIFSIFETNNFSLRIISIVLVWMVTCLSHYWVMKTVTDNPRAFNRIFMLQTTLKLLLYMACIVGYLYFYRQHGVSFTVHFFVVYLIFSIFDVALILKFVRKNTGSIKKIN